MTKMYATRTRNYGFERRGRLWLSWEVNGDTISDDYTPDGIDAAGLWREWRRRYPGDTQRIHWSVAGDGGIFEAAPHCNDGMSDFLTYFEWPEDERGNPVNWMALPVENKRWTTRRADKGGFIQEFTGWKPSPLQRVMDVAPIERLTFEREAWR